MASLLRDGAARSVPAAAPGDLVLFGEGTRTRELLPRVAARLGAHAVTNAIDLGLDGDRAVVTRPVVGGKAYGRFVCDGLCLLAFRPNSFSADEPAGLATTFVDAAVIVAPSRVEVLGREIEGDRRVELTEAHIVVAGGRGMKAPENLHLLEDLADALQGAVGVSRSIVDAGWAEPRHPGGQVGQDGGAGAVLRLRHLGGHPPHHGYGHLEGGGGHQHRSERAHLPVRRLRHRGRRARGAAGGDGRGAQVGRVVHRIERPRRRAATERADGRAARAAGDDVRELL